MVGVIAIGLVLEHGLSYWIALPVGVVVGAVMGALLEFLVIRRFQNATRLVLTVASIGLAQVLGGSSWSARRRSTSSRSPAGSTPRSTSTTSSTSRRCSGDEMLIIAIVPAVIARLAWFLLKTDAGIARAGVGRERGPGPVARHPGAPAVHDRVAHRGRAGGAHVHAPRRRSPA